MSDPKDGALVSMARDLGRSRSGQVFVAAAVVVFWCWLAYLAWHHRDLAARLLAFGLVFYGLSVAWRVLPIASATRARWAREQQIAGQCRACQWRFLLWFGIYLALLSLWRQGFSGSLDPHEFIAPAVFVVIGGISNFLCRRFIRHANTRNA